jgi:hypothetical protein
MANEPKDNANADVRASVERELFVIASSPAGTFGFRHGAIIHG